MTRPVAEILRLTTGWSGPIVVPSKALDGGLIDLPEMTARVNAHIQSSGRSFLTYAILSRIAAFWQNVGEFRQNFESYCDSENQFLIGSAYFPMTWRSWNEVEEELSRLVQEGLIYVGAPRHRANDSDVLELTQYGRYEESYGPAYCLTDSGASIWLHFESHVLNTPFYVYGKAECGYISISTQPPTTCLFGWDTPSCRLFSASDNVTCHCKVGYVAKWLGEWWRPIVPGYLLMCSEDHSIPGTGCTRFCTDIPKGSERPFSERTDGGPE